MSLIPCLLHANFSDLCVLCEPQCKASLVSKGKSGHINIYALKEIFWKMSFLCIAIFYLKHRLFVDLYFTDTLACLH
jgi:hypothetical protein